MNIALIYAGIGGCGFDSFGKDMESSWISHGLAMLSASAKAAGHEVRLIDLRRLSGWDHVAETLAAARPAIAGLTMMSVDFNPVNQTVAVLRERLPQTRIVVGGAHPSICTDEVAANAQIDHIITGEGEASFLELVDDIAMGRPSPRVIVGKQPDLDCLPFCDRELFGRFETPVTPDLEEPFVTLIAGRGCRYNCSFCQPAERILFGRAVRRRSVTSVINELKDLRAKYAFRSMMIHDDCLTEDPEWIQGFCDAYREEGFTQPFVCQSRADIICRHPDMVRAMRDVGLRLVFIGFESGNQRVLNFLRKGCTVEHNLEAARICRALGLKIWANYMLGIPTETRDEVMDTVRMIRAIDPDYYSPSFFTPHPGSDLYDYCLEHDLSLVKTHDGFRRNPNKAKVAGVDYAFLDRVVVLSMSDNPWKRCLLTLKRRLAKSERLKRFVKGLPGYGRLKGRLGV